MMECLLYFLLSPHLIMCRQFLWINNYKWQKPTQYCKVHNTGLPGGQVKSLNKICLAGKSAWIIEDTCLAKPPGSTGKLKIAVVLHEAPLTHATHGPWRPTLAEMPFNNLKCGEKATSGFANGTVAEFHSPFTLARHFSTSTGYDKT